jgi:hypothetical protein
MTCWRWARPKSNGRDTDDDQCTATGCEDAISREESSDAHSNSGQMPRSMSARTGIIIESGLQLQDVEPELTEVVGRHVAGSAGAYNDDVAGLALGHELVLPSVTVFNKTTIR